MLARRLAVTAAAILWLSFLFALHTTLGRVATAYHTRFDREFVNADPPLVAAKLGLPVLGHGPFAGVSEHWLWYATRALLVGCPLACVLVAWRVREARRLDLLMLYGLPVYSALFACVAIVVAFTLWFPFQCC